MEIVLTQTTSPIGTQCMYMSHGLTSCSMNRSKMHVQRTHSVSLKMCVCVCVCVFVCVTSLLEMTIVFSTCITVCKCHVFLCVLYASALCMCCAQEYMQ